MTDADRATYLDAFRAAQKRVEREGHQITHIVWRDGHLSFMSAKVFDDGEVSHAVRPDEQGTLL